MSFNLNQTEIGQGNYRSLAKVISQVENSADGAIDLLRHLKINYDIPVIGFTGPPGAGKSSLLNALLAKMANKWRIAILAVDPTSPFTSGSILGDRYRMNEYFLHQNVYIRSLATRGNLGGLSARTIEITDVLRSCAFDFIFIETVGVGQSEVEIAALADTTILVLNPGTGDDIQALKAGIMEIADVFVINKADRDQADALVKHIQNMLRLRNQAHHPPIFKTIATEGTGIDLLTACLMDKTRKQTDKQRLFYEKSIRLIISNKMSDFNYQSLKNKLRDAMGLKDFNLYSFLHENYFKK
jgi:LAO/AO transport system kinase